LSKPKPCYLCKSDALKEFPATLGRRSLTTDGQWVPLAARNAQCVSCGLMQKLQSHKKIFAHLSYQQNYEMYGRPDMRQFDEARYRIYAQWVAQYFPTAPKKLKVLEVGCGAGWILEILQKLFPPHQFEGIEPSLSAAKEATMNGVKITVGTLDETTRALTPGSYDFVFSFNVIEHTPDPVKFIKSLARMAKPDGRVLAICPNGDVLSVESLFIDHLYSLRKSNLQAVFRKAGLKPLDWAAGQRGMEELQLLQGVPAQEVKAPGRYSCPKPLIKKRWEYMHAWHRLDRILQQRLASCGRVTCFGAGETSDLISLFAPQAWAKVTDYAIDGAPDGRMRTYRGLPLYYLSELCKDSALLIGTKPHYQDRLYERLSKLFPVVVKWNDVVKL
jgi:2-polyprenyl-3-methyl-5-hydroxy-6-metoxy-1,4-benzoquinol methylase